MHNTIAFSGGAKYRPTEPIAPPGTLAAGQKVVITVVPRDATGAQVAGATVELSLESTNGARATVTKHPDAPDGTTLDATSKRFLTHTTTKVQITYTAPSAMPAGGEDRIIARAVSPTGELLSTTTIRYLY